MVVLFMKINVLSIYSKFQLILGVVGLPSASFLSEIASERVRIYISKLPQKEAVSLTKLFPNATSDAIDLLEKMLKLDPRERCSTVEALAHPYLARYSFYLSVCLCDLFLVVCCFLLLYITIYHFKIARNIGNMGRGKP